MKPFMLFPPDRPTMASAAKRLRARALISGRHRSEYDLDRARDRIITETARLDAGAGRESHIRDCCTVQAMARLVRLDITPAAALQLQFPEDFR